jgi:chlorobactene glucosyltransferase
MVYYYSDTIFITLFILQGSILFTLIYFLIYSIKSIKNVPILLPITNLQNISFPMISIILPARNEEKHIEKCLDSLIKQEYPNFEIVVINDSSFDDTDQIIKRYSITHRKITYVNAQPKPEGWTGKNWACYQGYLQSKGDLFLFTDADTIHHPSIISLAATYLLSEKLDTITAIPKTLTYDFWTKITLPLLWIFSVARFSALKANNPKTKVGYFFGCFFIITRKAYEMVGTHKSVRQEIVEDAELGKKVKEQGFSIRVVHGEKYIKAVWARDSSSLWHGLRRIMIPLFKKEKIKATKMIIAMFVLILFPITMLPLSVINIIDEKTETKSVIILFLAIMSILLIVINNVLQLKCTVFQNLLYSLGFPLSGSFILAVFLSSRIGSSKKGIVSWRNRKYSIRL